MSNESPGEFPAVPTEHPSEFDGCGCTSLGEHILVVQATALRRELRRTKLMLVQSEAQIADLDGALDATLRERDSLEERLDDLAYAVAPIEVLGEHSSANCPWANARRLLGKSTPAGGLHG